MKHKLSLLVSLLCCLLALQQHTYAINNVYFIRLNIDDERIELGTFSTTLNKEVESVIGVNALNSNSNSEFKNFFNSHIKPDGNRNILFFIHAMWGSNNMFVRSQVIDFHESYIENNVIQSVFYILWDTRPATYYGNKRNAIESSDLLGKLFDILGELNTNDLYNYNMMCHSMGNKLFFRVMETQQVKKHLFNSVVFAAPDIDENLLHVELINQNLKLIADTCFVLYNKYDGLLMLSEIRNFYSPLGLRPDISISNTSPHIQFINCSFLTDNNKFPSSVTGHLYYSTSISTKRRIRDILSS